MIAQNFSSSQFYTLTLQQAVTDYKAGLLTASGLLVRFFQISLAPGWRRSWRPSEIWEMLGISRSAFYKAIPKLALYGISVDFDCSSLIFCRSGCVDSVIEPQPEPQPEPQMRSQPEPQMRSQPEPQMRSQPEPQMRSQPEPQMRSQPEPQMRSQPEPQMRSQPEPQMRSQPEPQMRSQPEPQMRSQPEPDLFSDDHYVEWFRVHVYKLLPSPPPISSLRAVAMSPGMRSRWFPDFQLFVNNKLDHQLQLNKLADLGFDSHSQLLQSLHDRLSAVVPDLPFPSVILVSGVSKIAVKSVYYDLSDCLNNPGGFDAAVDYFIDSYTSRPPSSFRDMMASIVAKMSLSNNT